MSSDAAPSQRIRGTVKRFSDASGYGFIRGEDGIDVFVHYGDITGDGFRTLVPEEEVEYEIEQRLKGPAAIRVRRIRPAGHPVAG